jgi:Kef-type K+ transport system membrane component KefB
MQADPSGQKANGQLLVFRCFAMPPTTESQTNVAPLPRRFGALSAYLAMLAIAVALFMLIDRIGTGLIAPEVIDAGARTAAVKGNSLLLVHVLIALVAVVVAGQLLGRLFRYLNQPPVIGEVVAGIMLGPSLLGQLWPDASAFLLPANVGPFIGVIAQLGVILYMFLVGHELNPAALRNRVGKTLAISHAGIAIPFVGGAALSLYLYPILSDRDVRFTSFALFMGVAMSVTAFPVLARILTDRRMHTTPLGIAALGAAAAGDVTAWCLLAFVVGVVQAAVGAAVLTIALTAAFIVVMLIVVRPLLVRVLRYYDDAPLTPAIIATVLVSVLTSALTTEAIGIHALFGAFILGAIIPHDNRLVREFGHKVEDLVNVLLLPAFFASVGMRTEIGLVSGLGNWLICGLIVVVATLGKFGGTYAAARATGLDRRNAAGLGVLMNTRGLMELIVLNIGLEMKVISPTLFAMLVLMALATTVATGPALQLLGIDGSDVRTCR